MTCDCCGKKLEPHGLRYTMRLGRVPISRSAGEAPFDLCDECANKIRSMMKRGSDGEH